MKTYWYLKPNQVMIRVASLGALSAVVNLASAQPWTMTSYSSEPFLQSLAASADGKRLIAAIPRMDDNCWGPPPSSSTFASIVLSTNAGATWIQTTAPTNNFYSIGPTNNYWSCVASSADGTKLVAAAGLFYQTINGYTWQPISAPGPIYTSQDSGTTWTMTAAPNNAWSGLASSADGRMLVAVATTNTDGSTVGDGLIYLSSDFGTTWARASAPSNPWTSIAVSADGTRLIAAASMALEYGPASFSVGGILNSNGLIYTSTNSGATWAPSLPVLNTWSYVASSADGNKLAAASVSLLGNFDPFGFNGDGLIYVSDDAGVTWRPTSAPSGDWACIASSADGSTLLAGVAWGPLYASSDSGWTWSAADVPGSSNWRAVAVSADGYREIATAGGGFSRLVLSFPYSGPWKTSRAPVGIWNADVSSSDGSKLVAVSANGIFVSTDSGASWVQWALADGWSSIAASADATKLVAAAWVATGTPGEFIYRSTDSGMSWVPTTAPRNLWTGIASSEDGTRLVAVATANASPGPAETGLVYTSADSGATWTPTSAPTNLLWGAVASSADGDKLFAAAELSSYFTTVVISTNAGATWLQSNGPTNQEGWPVTFKSSADGTKLLLVLAYYPDCPIDSSCVTDYYLYISTNSGASWVQAPVLLASGASAAMSNDGKAIVAVAVPGSGTGIYISTNLGVTWESADAPAGSWQAAAISADGNNVVVLADGFDCILQATPPSTPSPPSPVLSIEHSAADLRLSWLVTSTSFVLQQSSDLIPHNWMDVTNRPGFNFTNLHYEVSLTPLPGSALYRLRSRSQ
jgi:hypothetical protein